MNGNVLDLEELSFMLDEVIQGEFDETMAEYHNCIRALNMERDILKHFKNDIKKLEQKIMASDQLFSETPPDDDVPGSEDECSEDDEDQGPRDRTPAELASLEELRGKFKKFIDTFDFVEDFKKGIIALGESWSEYGYSAETRIEDLYASLHLTMCKEFDGVFNSYTPKIHGLDMIEDVLTHFGKDIEKIQAKLVKSGIWPVQEK